MVDKSNKHYLSKVVKFNIKSRKCLAGMAQWLNIQPVNQEATVLFPARAHAQVVGSTPMWGGQEAVNQ